MQHVQLRLVGPITAYGGQTYVTSQTGTGSTFVMQASPTITGTLTANKTDTTAWSSAAFWNGTFSGPVLLNPTSTTNAITGIGFYGGANSNAVAGIAMVQATANSIGDLVLAAGGAGVANTVPERMRLNGSTGAVTIPGSLAITGTTTFTGIATASAANAQIRVDRSATGAGKYAFFGWYTAGAVKWQAGIDGDLDDTTWSLFDIAAGIYAIKVATGGNTTLVGSITAKSAIVTGSTVPANGMYLPSANTLGWATNTTNWLNLTSDGRLYGVALHNNSGAVTGTTNQYIASKTYTPTGTALGVSSVTPAQGNAIRVGNVVHVTGNASVVLSSVFGSQPQSFRLTLPIASTIAGTTKLSGAAVAQKSLTAPIAVSVQAASANDEAFFVFQSSDTSATYTVTYAYSYEVA